MCSTQKSLLRDTCTPRVSSSASRNNIIRSKAGVGATQAGGRDEGGDGDDLRSLPSLGANSVLCL